MMLTRKIGKLLRGKATPMQLMLACLLGAMIGFIPGFAQGPGLTILLVVLLVILNANLFLATVVGLLAKAVSIPLAPVTFLVGRALLDGPTSGMFQSMINMPVLALFGFEYYLVTGGIPVAIVFGVIVGMLIIRSIMAFRKKMASLQEGSDRYKTWTSKWYVKLFTFVFIGGGGKKVYEKLLTKRVGNPIRPIGVVAAGLIVACAWVVLQFFNEPIVTAALKSGLERANGATVDIQSADLNLRESRLSLHGFAMADANNLNADLLRAERIDAAVSSRDLLRKRMALDEVVLVNASSGETRTSPGRHVGRMPRPFPEDPTIRLPEEKTLEEYIEQAKQWKERLAQIRRWLERVSGPEETAETDPAERRETMKERLDRRIRELGYAYVRADHLIDETPTFIVYRMDAERMKTKHLDDATVDVRCRNLSTHPHLNEEPASVRIESSDERLLAALSLDHLIDAERTSSLQFRLEGLDTDSIAKHLILGGNTLIAGGTMDIETSGTYGEEGPGWVNLPLIATLHNANITIGGREQQVDRLTLPIRVRGPLDQPLITVDDDQLAQALLDAGAAGLVRELEDRLKLDERIGEQLDRIGDRVPGLGDTLREGAGGLFRRGNNNDE